MLWLFLLGCKVVDAPENIEELMIFGFENQSTEDPAWPAAFATNLLPELDRHADDLEKGYRVDSLTAENILQAGFSTDAEVEITGIAATSLMTSTLDDVLAAVSLPDTTVVFSSTKVYELEKHSDRSCFLEGDCEFYTYEVHRTLDLGLLGTATQDVIGSLRRLRLEDGMEVALWQTASPSPAVVSTDIMKVQQQYSQELLFPTEGGGTTRASAIWLDAELVGGDIPDSFLISTSVNSLQKAGEDIDAFIEGGGLR